MLKPIAVKALVISRMTWVVGCSRPIATGRPGKGHVQAVKLGSAGQLGLVDPGRALLKLLFQAALGLVAQGARGTSFLKVKLGQTAKDGGQTSAPAQVGHTPLVEGLRVVNLPQFGQGVIDQIFD